MTNILGFFYYLINFLTPKSNNKTCIISFPDFDDMTRGLVCKLPKGTRCIVLVKGDESKVRPSWLPESINVVNKNSMLGLFHLLSCNRIYFTHGIFSFFRKIPAKRQHVFNMWHGMPLKNIGFLDGKSEVPDSHTVFSTSNFFSPILEKAFGCDDVRVCGLPRNDILLMKSKSAIIHEITNSFDRVIVWLPTYRASKIGDIRNDGSSDSLLPFLDLDIEFLNFLLSKNNILLLIKPHPMASFSTDINLFRKLSNVDVIDDIWLKESDLTLYELLARSDMLFTDVSSVFIDYCLTKKPIKFIIDDFDEYKNSRGFTYDIKLTPLPGEVVSDLRSFYKMLDVLSFDLERPDCFDKYHSLMKYRHQE